MQTKQQKSILSKVGRINNKFVYLALVIILCGPLISPLGLPLLLGEETQFVYDYIDQLPEGSLIVISMDFSSNHIEIILQARVFLQHVLDRPIKFIMPSFEVEGNMMTLQIFNYLDVGNNEYGIDYVMIPYIPGGDVAIAAFAKDVRGIVSTDYYGTSLDDLPIMNEFQSMDDIDFWFVFSGPSAGGGGIEPTIKQIKAPYDTPLACGLTTVQVPGVYPYFKSGLIIGLLAGQRGAAEYELINKTPGEAVKQTDSLSLGHLYVISLVVLGNISYFYEKSKGVKR